MSGGGLGDPVILTGNVPGGMKVGGELAKLPFLVSGMERKEEWSPHVSSASRLGWETQKRLATTRGQFYINSINTCRTLITCKMKLNEAWVLSSWSLKSSEAKPGI